MNAKRGKSRTKGRRIDSQGTTAFKGWREEVELSEETED